MTRKGSDALQWWREGPRGGAERSDIEPLLMGCKHTHFCHLRAIRVFCFAALAKQILITVLQKNATKMQQQLQQQQQQQQQHQLFVVQTGVNKDVDYLFYCLHLCEGEESLTLTSLHS